MSMPIRNVCVFSSSSKKVDAVYFGVAGELGRALADHGCALVYGGTSVGPMDEVAKALRAAGGRVIGVVPESMRGLASAACSEMVFEPDLHARKARMESLADAFVCLPGGLGTMDEVFEALALRQLGAHEKPVVFINVDGFFDPLEVFFSSLANRHFMKQEALALYRIAGSLDEAMDYLGLASR